MVLQSREFLREGLQWEYPYGGSFLVGEAGEMREEVLKSDYKAKGSSRVEDLTR